MLHPPRKAVSMGSTCRPLCGAAHLAANASSSQQGCDRSHKQHTSGDDRSDDLGGAHGPSVAQCLSIGSVNRQ